MTHIERMRICLYLCFFFLCIGVVLALMTAGTIPPASPFFTEAPHPLVVLVEGFAAGTLFMRAAKERDEAGLAGEFYFADVKRVNKKLCSA